MTQKTLQAIIAEGLSQAAIDEHGRALVSYRITVGTEPIAPSVPGNFVTLTIAPDGFDYKAQKFGIDNNTLLTTEELEARRQYLVNESPHRVMRPRALRRRCPRAR
jgi:hypothetical protein